MREEHAAKTLLLVIAVLPACSSTHFALPAHVEVVGLEVSADPFGLGEFKLSSIGTMEVVAYKPSLPITLSPTKKAL